MNTSLQAIIITDSDNKKETKIDFFRVKKATLILRALNHKLRQQIIKLIDENKKMKVTEIYIKLRLEQSVASQHLAILRRAGIVSTQREGKFIYYAINYTRAKEVNDFIEKLTG